MDLPDQVTLEAYDGLPSTLQILYKKDENNATLDIGLNNILQRGGYTAAQGKLKNQLNDLSTLLNKFQAFAETPETLAEKIQKLEALEASQVNGNGDLKKKIDEIKVASEKRLNDELLRQGTSLKQVITELEGKNKSYHEQVQGIKLWEEISKLAPDLKPKYHQTFKESLLKLFTLDDDNKLKLAGTDPESLINTPVKKMDSLRKEFSELFQNTSGSVGEFSPYNKYQNEQTINLAKNDYQEAVKNRDVNAMRSAQRRMQK